MILRDLAAPSTQRPSPDANPFCQPCADAGRKRRAHLITAAGVPKCFACHRQRQAVVHCLMCSTDVPALVALSENLLGRPEYSPVPRQRCPHCTSLLDAATVLEVCDAH